MSSLTKADITSYLYDTVEIYTKADLIHRFTCFIREETSVQWRRKYLAGVHFTLANCQHEYKVSYCGITIRVPFETIWNMNGVFIYQRGV
jgi:tRNA uridine 5-carbamoylmethylation protein Kti12